MTDKNGYEVHVENWVWSTADGEERVILVTEVTSTEQDMLVERIPISDPRFSAFIQAGGFSGGGGSFGGGGASGSW